MSKDKESFGSRFLYAETLLNDGAYKTVNVEIAEFHPGGTLTTEDGRVIKEPAISFVGKDKILVLCKTNVSILHFVTGNQPGAKWVGFLITLQARLVDAFGDLVPAIRVIPPDGCKIRKSLIKRLGKKAEWVSSTQKEEHAGQH